MSSLTTAAAWTPESIRQALALMYPDAPWAADATKLTASPPATSTTYRARACNGDVADEWPLLRGFRVEQQAQAASTGKQKTDTVVLDLTVQPALRWFEGHYPTMPILAGIAQVHIAAGYGQHLFDVDGDFTGLDAVKFTRLIEPGNRIQLRLNLGLDDVLRFQFIDQEHAYSSGRIVFGNH